MFKFFQMPYNKEPSRMESKQCLWPLIWSADDDNSGSRPIIDKCYLPCRFAFFIVLYCDNNSKCLYFL